MPAKFAAGALLTRSFLCSSSAVIYAILLISPAAAQEPVQTPVEGYITAVQSPDTFVLDGQQVILQPNTTLA